jgi:hypothetical protein
MKKWLKILKKIEISSEILIFLVEKIKKIAAMLKKVAILDFFQKYFLPNSSSIFQPEVCKKSEL